MTLQIINDIEINFPMNLLTTEESASSESEEEWVPFNCCDYSIYSESEDFRWQE